MCTFKLHKRKPQEWKKYHFRSLQSHCWVSLGIWGWNTDNPVQWSQPCVCLPRLQKKSLVLKVTMILDFFFHLGQGVDTFVLNLCLHLIAIASKIFDSLLSLLPPIHTGNFKLWNKPNLSQLKCNQTWQHLILMEHLTDASLEWNPYKCRQYAQCKQIKNYSHNEFQILCLDKTTNCY